MDTPCLARRPSPNDESILSKHIYRTFIAEASLRVKRMNRSPRKLVEFSPPHRVTNDRNGYRNTLCRAPITGSHPWASHEIIEDQSSQVQDEPSISPAPSFKSCFYRKQRRNTQIAEQLIRRTWFPVGRMEGKEKFTELGRESTLVICGCRKRTAK